MARSEPGSAPDPSNPYIVRTEDVCHGKPRIAGTRIRVDYVYERVEGRGLNPQTVADRHGLDVADVYRALAYYHEHPEEMARIRESRERAARAGGDDPNVIRGPDELEEKLDR